MAWGIENSLRAAGKSCSGKAPGWGRLGPGRTPCAQAHPLSSNPAVDDARDKGAYRLPGREAEDELLEALELAAPQVLGVRMSAARRSVGAQRSRTSY